MAAPASTSFANASSSPPDRKRTTQSAGEPGIGGRLRRNPRTESTALTAFTDGCPGLRRILLDAGVAGLPTLDRFHVAMRLQHLTQIAGSLSSDGPERAA